MVGDRWRESCDVISKIRIRCDLKPILNLCSSKGKKPISCNLKNVHDAK